MIRLKAGFQKCSLRCSILLSVVLPRLINFTEKPNKVTSEEPSKKKKKKKPSKKPNKPPKIVSRKVVIVDPDGNELNLEDALKYGYIDQKNYEELKNQENEYDDK